jgi:hypothetical protein
VDMVSIGDRSGRSVAKFTNEGVSVKFAVLVVVHLDTRLVVVDAFGDHAVSGETIEQLLFVDVLGKRFDVDGRVDALLRLFALLLLRSLLCVEVSRHALTAGRDSPTYILSFDSLALLSRVNRRLVIVDTRHFVCCALLLCKRFIHLYRTKGRNVRIPPRPM